MTSARLIRLSLIAPPSTAEGAEISPARAATDPAVNTQLDATLTAHLDAVYRYALRLTRTPEQAQDLTQETMLRAWKNRHTLHETAATKSWLLRITTNLWTDQLRRQRHQPSLLVEPATVPALTKQPPIERQEQLDQALAALDALPPRQRQVMHLITVEQLPQADIAEILSLTPQAVKSNLAAARKTLRHQLQDLYNEVRGKSSCPNPSANNSKTT